MEKFLSLPGEKQNQILDAAYACFGQNGYKKTSVSDIASAAGISKSMVFHYFGTKKGLYVYLISLGGKLLIDEITKHFDSGNTDFFERIRTATEIKISVMKKHPGILTFFNSVYSENDPEVAKDLKNLWGQGEGFRSKLALEGVDISKFKDGVDPKLVLSLLVRFAEGYISELPGTAALDIDAISGEFDRCLDLLKNNLYKKEYLNKTVLQPE